MYGDVWQSAGTFRTTERNLGVAPWAVQPGLHDLLSDAGYWLESVHATVPTSMSVDEFCLRLSHRAVQIRPFPNGNGRWSRLLADAAAVVLQQPPFTWRATLATPTQPV